ncbi:MAG: peptidase MA family metallohydrolase [Gemmatimonadales bacterium]
MTVGRVTAYYWSGDGAAATALAELADRAGPWPGIPDVSNRPIRILLAPSEELFDSLTRGRLPEWGAAAAFPGGNTVVIDLSAGNPMRVLRHELAHLALHSRVRYVPRWFDEGYAAWAAGEWDRVDALRVNWALLRGAVPSLEELDRYLVAQGPARAEAAYALSTTAVLLLDRLGGDRGLEPLLSALEHTVDFDGALRQGYRITLGQFEDRWRRDLKRRYGWLLFFSSFAVFWGLVGTALMALWFWRRRRDRARRAALNDGWVISEEL